MGQLCMQNVHHKKLKVLLQLCTLLRLPAYCNLLQTVCCLKRHVIRGIVPGSAHSHAWMEGWKGLWELSRASVLIKVLGGLLWLMIRSLERSLTISHSSNQSHHAGGHQRAARNPQPPSWWSIALINEQQVIWDHGILLALYEN